MPQHLDYLDQVPLDVVNDGLIRAALEERRSDMLACGGAAMDADIFWTSTDLDTYRQAAVWWPLDAPHSCTMPTLRELCMYVAGPANAKLMPAADVLALLGQRCVAWLESEKRDVARPNESADERRRRLGRESVARHRALSREAATNPQAARIRGLHAAYIEACRARKAAASAHDTLVDAAKAKWEAAKAETKQPA